MSRPDRWEKAAERETARRRRDAGPLFAALVAPADPAAVKARTERIVDAHARAIEQHQIEAEQRGQEARAILAAHVTPEELAAIDRRRAACPPSGGYTASVYSDACRERGLPWPGKEAYDALWGEVHRLEAIEAQKEAARAAAAGEQLDLPTRQRIAAIRARFPEVMSEEDQVAFEEAAEVEMESAEDARRGRAA